MNNLPGDFMEKNVGKCEEEDLEGDWVGGGDIQCSVLQRIYVGN